MKNFIHLKSILLFTLISAAAAPSTLEDREIQILREEIQRQEIILKALKEKRSRLEEKKVTNTIKVEIDENGFRFEGQELIEKDLEKKIAAIPLDGAVTILADERIPLRQVTYVMDLLNDHGISDVSFAVSKSEPDEGGNSD